MQYFFFCGSFLQNYVETLKYL